MNYNLLTSGGSYNTFSPFGNTEKMAQKIIALGPDAYPALEELLLREDSALDKLYDQVRQKGPKFIRRVLPQRVPKDRTRMKVISTLPHLGPLARPLTSSMIVNLRATTIARNIPLLHALSWSLTDSETASAAFQRHLTDTHNNHYVFGISDFDPFWSMHPEFISLLENWLDSADSATQAANALGAVGTNAISSLPVLVKFWNDSTIRPPPLPPETESSLPPIPFIEPLKQQRKAVIRAFGRIGHGSPEVLSCLLAAWQSPNRDFRALAAASLYQIGRSAAPILPTLLASIDDKNERVFARKLLAIGAIATDSREARETLHYWASQLDLTVVWEDREEITQRSHETIDLPLQLTAAYALVSMDPTNMERMPPTILAEILQSNLRIEFLHVRRFLDRLKPAGSLIVPIALQNLKPSLDLNLDSVNLAARMLYLVPECEPALNYLQTAMNDKAPGIVAAAGRDYFHATGNIEESLQILSKALEMNQDINDPQVIESIGSLEAKAIPLRAPLIKLLWSTNTNERHAAIRAIRKIGVEGISIPTSH